MTRGAETWKLRALVFLPAALAPLFAFARLYHDQPARLIGIAAGLAAASALVVALRLLYLRTSLSAASRRENPLLAPRLRGVLAFALIDVLWLRLFFPADVEVWRFALIASLAAVATPAYAGPREFRLPSALTVLILQWILSLTLGGAALSEPQFSVTPGGAPIVVFAVYELAIWAALRVLRAPAAAVLSLAFAILSGLSLAPLIGLDWAVGASACVFAVREFPGRQAEPPGRALLMGAFILAGVVGLPVALGYANFAGARLPEALTALGAILCVTLVTAELLAAASGAYAQRARGRA